MTGLNQLLGVREIQFKTFALYVRTVSAADIGTFVVAESDCLKGLMLPGFPDIRSCRYPRCVKEMPPKFGDQISKIAVRRLPMHIAGGAGRKTGILVCQSFAFLSVNHKAGKVFRLDSTMNLSI